jgi:hypothetical protein
MWKQLKRQGKLSEIRIADLDLKKDIKSGDTRYSGWHPDMNILHFYLKTHKAYDLSM